MKWFASRLRRRGLRAGHRAPVEQFTGLEPMEPRLMMAADIIISEVYYNQPGTDNVEWVELYNAGNMTQDLDGWAFTSGFTFAFEDEFELAPGQYAVIVNNVATFTALYGGGIRIAGVIQAGSLSNDGERLILENDDGLEIANLNYDDTAPWPTRPDGDGSSLQIIEFTPEAIADRYDDDNWMASRELNGSPGRAGVINNPGVVINEVLAASNDAIMERDKIELYNPTDQPINIGGYYLSDSDEFELKFQIPANTILDPGQFIVFDETQFNTGPNAFALSSSSGEVLSLLQQTGNTTLFLDSVEFGATDTSVSLGRIPDGDGLLFPNTAQTFGAPNAGAVTSALVIDEIMYHHSSDNDDFEFIELLNRGGTTLTLQNNWRIRGDIDFDFPAGTNLAPGERLLVLRFNPVTETVKRNAFQQQYGISLNTVGGVKAVGGYGGTAAVSLSNRAALLEVQQLIDFGGGVTGYALRDHVDYRDRNDWPGRADGLGASLDRIDPAGYGNDPSNWNSSFNFNGSPGGVDDRSLTVVINEVLAHSDVPLRDAIELYNVTDNPIDISGWLLTDDINNVFKYQFPDGTMLPAGQYISVSAAEFNPNPGSGTSFALDADTGETLNLIQTNGFNGALVRIADRVTFGGSFINETFGRIPNGTGELFPQKVRTMQGESQFDFPGTLSPYTDGANAGPRTDIIIDDGSGDVIISEVNFNPGGDSGDDLEFVELYNRTGTAKNLGPIENGFGLWSPEGWRLNDAVDFEFNASHVIPAFGTIVVVGFDPVAEPAKKAAFEAHYGIAGQGVIVLGPFEDGDHLDNVADTVELEKPDFSPSTIIDPTDRFTPNVIWDRLPYNSVDPWPTSTAGGGDSLQRLGETLFGDFVTSWEAAAPTPGSTPQFTPIVPPSVANIIVSSSQWSQAFLDAVSAPGQAVQGYAIPVGSGAQLANLPWTNIDRVTVVFSEDVNVPVDALSVNGLNVPAYGLNAPSYNEAAFAATWPLFQPFGQDRIDLSIVAASVTDDTSAILDGEWTNSVSTFPSGNGDAGGNFSFRFNVRPGDLNGDNAVNAIDIDLLAGIAHSGGAYSIYLDLNNDGVITSADTDRLVNDVLGTQYGDINLDKKVNITDLSIVATFFGGSGGWSTGDLTGDGIVNIADLSRLATFFGFDNSGGGGGSADVLAEAKPAAQTVQVSPKADSDDDKAGSATSWGHIVDILAGE